MLYFRKPKRKESSMSETTENHNNNQININDLPITVDAFEDENGYALVLTSKDARIGNSAGVLVKNFLVRIARGDVPQPNKTHPVQIGDGVKQTVEVDTVRIDETGKMFVTSAADKVQRPVA